MLNRINNAPNLSEDQKSNIGSSPSLVPWPWDDPYSEDNTALIVKSMGLGANLLTYNFWLYPLVTLYCLKHNLFHW